MQSTFRLWQDLSQELQDIKPRQWEVRADLQHTNISSTYSLQPSVLLQFMLHAGKATHTQTHKLVWHMFMPTLIRLVVPRTLSHFPGSGIGRRGRIPFVYFQGCSELRPRGFGPSAAETVLSVSQPTLSAPSTSQAACSCCQGSSLIRQLRLLFTRILSVACVDDVRLISRSFHLERSSKTVEATAAPQSGLLHRS